MTEIDDGLSAEDLVNIARLTAKHIYRIYFNIETGKILAASNEFKPEYDHSLIVSYEQYDALVANGDFKDWVVVKTNTVDNEYGVELIRKEFQGQAFRNHMFEWIVDSPKKNTELTVHWDEYNQQWIFVISDNARQRYYDGKITTKIVKIFITLQNDLDFLIRTIDIEIKSLVADKVVVPFSTNLETQIDRISVSSKTVFESYGLKVWKDKTQ
jgi:hypothetical protein